MGISVTPPSERVKAVLAIPDQHPWAGTVPAWLKAAPGTRGIQGFIDHYFYRRKYDAQQAIDAFTSALRAEIDLETLNHELLGVVDQTMQPRSVSIWLLSEDAR